ncbi:hypothetical protein [Collimonas sp.]|uniref:hypothetical protein n=1 Tax=Collimonas sp. TaxID=1963772 RepID=UPI002B5379A3|nr:hypothetical protein [Collimonas sp.]HWW05614.1 hypothetical protein [Collimonas sp.]
MAAAYTLKKDKDTAELHLFEGKMTTPQKCTSDEKSICKKMTKSQTAGNEFACEDEKNARIKCASIGRAVCGICVSHLYADYS